MKINYVYPWYIVKSPLGDVYYTVTFKGAVRKAARVKKRDAKRSVKDQRRRVLVSKFNETL